MIAGQALPGAACAPDAWNTNTLSVKRMVDLFYADEQHEPDDIEQAKAICATCCVRTECLDINMSERFGVFGGLTATERKDLRRVIRMQ